MKFMKFCSKCSFEAVGGLEARGIWARDQIGDGIIEFWVDAESEIFDFRGLDDRTSIEHLSKLISLRDSRRGTSRLRGLEAGGIWARDQIGDGISEFWVDAEYEIFDFRGLDGRTSIEHL